MVAALSLTKTIEDASDFLLDDVNDTAVLNAARQLIARHRAGHAFDIDALDIPHRALATIAEKLEQSGAGHALSRPLVEALRRYVMESGGAFARAVNAKPVLIRMIVAPEMPQCRFENGMTELACLGTGEVRLEGGSSINVRATPTGTATTSNAANVDAMFANVKGLHLWIRFESPTREDMDSLLSSMDAALAGIAQSVGGAMGAEDFKKLVEQLEQEGSLTPAVLDLIGKMILLQEGLKAGTLTGDTLKALLEDMGALMNDIRESNLAPPALLEAIMSSMADLPANQAVLSFLTEQGFQGILADNDNLPSEVLEAQEMAQDLMALLEDIAQQIESGEIALEDLPQELSALIESMGGIEALLDPASRAGHVELLAEALSGNEANTLSETIHAAMIALTDPQNLSVLPPSLTAHIDRFLDSNPAIVEMAVTASLISGMQAGAQITAPETPAAMDMQGAIALLQQSGFTPLLSADVQASLPLAAVAVIQDFSDTHPHGVEIAATHSFIGAVETAMRGIDTSSPVYKDMTQLAETVGKKGVSEFFKDNPILPPRVQEFINKIFGGGENLVPTVNPPQSAPDITPKEEKLVPKDPPSNQDPVNPPRPDVPGPREEPSPKPSEPPKNPNPPPREPERDNDSKQGPTAPEKEKPPVSDGVKDCCKDLLGKLPSDSKTPEARDQIRTVFEQEWGEKSGGPDNVSYNPDTDTVTVFEDGKKIEMTYAEFLQETEDYATAMEEKDQIRTNEIDLDDIPGDPTPSPFDPEDPKLRPEFENAKKKDDKSGAGPGPQSIDDAFGFSDFTM